MLWDNEKIENAFLSVGVADAASDAYDEAIAAAQIMRDDYENALGNLAEKYNQLVDSTAELLAGHRRKIDSQRAQIAQMFETIERAGLLEVEEEEEAYD